MTLAKIIRRIRTSAWNRRRVLRQLERTQRAVHRAELDRWTLAASHLGKARQDVSWEIAQTAREAR